MKKVRVAINGFGRIGRQVFRAMYGKYGETAEIVAINDLMDANTNFHLLQHDSAYGPAAFTCEVASEKTSVGGVDSTMVKVGDWNVACLAERDPNKLPWKDLDVDVVVESTGIFRSAPQAGVHLERGAKKVIISAPAKQPDLTVVMGVNQDMYDPAKHNILSNASCTTNCLAPVAKVMHQEFGIKLGSMVTVHSYTNDQRILDLPHKDLRRARAAALNIIPTSTGAAKAVAEVIPSLKGRFAGYALRVPTPTVSIVDFTAVLEKSTDAETLVNAFRAASDTYLKGILGVNDLPLVSMDFKGDSRSSIVESEYCTVQDGNLAKVVSWYDNEWAYSVRVTDLIHYMQSKGF
ncbi:type I glyceraldehyde-3-phosphate dehydrogenase [uncultured Mailhella sp.]|uniref:type I glyceraldehyde-3-phosphate dehydrogenase n=1 Tax=uncultured Mailhella sp. TaxID=1981031 RepID=UPI0025E00B6C|nr:type I glyceraldehyde-3-phosphate dehydrogenase [uncultured Mailhella sp.]